MSVLAYKDFYYYTDYYLIFMHFIRNKLNNEQKEHMKIYNCNITEYCIINYICIIY